MIIKNIFSYFIVYHRDTIVIEKEKYIFGMNYIFPGRKVENKNQKKREFDSK